MVSPFRVRARLPRWLAAIALGWGTAGAFADSGPSRIAVEPATVRLDGAGDRQQVAVTGTFADGSVRYREDVVEGLESVPEAFRGLLTGKNFGKLLVRVSSDPTI